MLRLRSSINIVFFLFLYPPSLLLKFLKIKAIGSILKISNYNKSSKNKIVLVTLRLELLPTYSGGMSIHFLLKSESTRQPITLLGILTGQRKKEDCFEGMRCYN